MAAVKPKSKIAADAVLLIPEPEDGQAPAYGVKDGYYAREQMLDLLASHKDNQGAIQFIADMLETGSTGDDAFAHMLRANSGNPIEISRIADICKAKA